jgi:hypothetical protein
VPSHINKNTDININLSLNQITSTVQFYTVPYVSRVDNEAINVLFGFTSKDMCLEHLMEEDSVTKKDISVLEYDLEDMKAISTMLRMPLIIELSKHHFHYELYYYKGTIKNKDT